jgi:hypothetical protein
MQLCLPRTASAAALRARRGGSLKCTCFRYGREAPVLPCMTHLYVQACKNCRPGRFSGIAERVCSSCPPVCCCSSLPVWCFLTQPLLVVSRGSTIHLGRGMRVLIVTKVDSRTGARQPNVRIARLTNTRICCHMIVAMLAHLESTRTVAEVQSSAMPSRRQRQPQHQRCPRHLNPRRLRRLIRRPRRPRSRPPTQQASQRTRLRRGGKRSQEIHRCELSWRQAPSCPHC